MLFKGVILKAAQNIQMERSVASIHYLLIGTTNIQTQQDAQIFGNQSFYGIYKELRKFEFDQKVNELIDQGFLKAAIDAKERVVAACTEKGNEWLRQHQEEFAFHHFQGMKYEEKASMFYNRLLLLVQTLSNIKESHFSFIPVITDKDAEHFVRTIYRKIKGNELKYIENLHSELERVLSHVTDEEATIFVERLTGFHHYGKSIAQLGATHKKSLHDIRLIITRVLHQLLLLIERKQVKVPILASLVQDLEKPLNLTASAYKTYELFQKGYTTEEIAQRRRLKVNTIYDHLTEIALHDKAFPFEKFVSARAKNEILTVIEKTNTFKLKAIKEQISPNISFFQIRLMLVYHHRKKEVDSFV